MNKYSPYDFNQATINEIKQNGRKWSLDKPYYDEFLVELPKLVQKFDLSEIITKVDYPGKHVSIFNAVGELASYAQLAKWAENAIKDEQQGENEKANNQWKAIKAVLEYAKTSGIDYCSLIRGWENNKGAAQGDQILKLLLNKVKQNIDLSIDELKIAKIIIDEADKGEYGLYAIPNNYKNNENVKHAANEHMKWYESVIKDDDFSMLQALSYSVDTSSILQEENLIDLSEDNSTLSPEMSKDQNNLNDEQLAALVHQETTRANAEEIPHAQPSTSSNREEGSIENTILGMQAKDLVTLINAGVQALDGTTNPQDAQGRTAEDFVTQVSNLLQATGGDINNLWDMVPDILGNSQNTMMQLGI
ncbi:MAG: hypothetical protein LN546_01340 [Rickettsia endosymbiont of Ecitomorpha arachnoides]|nr:hypothetical protein [Rickettsia endosymbiont of Ecitomorpha arachnoides]